MSNQASTKLSREIIAGEGIFFGYSDDPPAIAIADTGSGCLGDAREIKQHYLATVLTGARYLCVWDKKQRSDLNRVLCHLGVHRIGTSRKEREALTRMDALLRRTMGADREALKEQIKKKQPGKIVVVSSLFDSHPLGAGHRAGEQRGLDQVLVMASLPSPKGKGPLRIAQSLSALVAKMAQSRYS